MTTIFDSTRPVKVTRPFAAGVLRHTAADERWWAENAPSNTRDFDVESRPAPLPEPDWDAMAREAWAQHCLDQGLDPFDPDVIAQAIEPEESAAYDRIP